MPKLKNGEEEVESIIVVTMAVLNDLMITRPISLVDLVLKCKDKDYVFFGDNEATLIDLALLDSNGMVYRSIRNIVLSAITGDGLEISLGSPLA